MIAIVEARRDQLVPAARLLGAVLGFEPADSVPPWLMLTAAASGGLVLVACSGDEVVGASFAIHGVRDRVPFLFSCGLAVAPAHRRRGLGRALKLEQRRQALRRGIEVIRWTADPLNGPGLILYLSGLGARLTAYRAELYDGLRAGDGVPQDDVEIEWRLGDGPVRAAAAGTVVRVAGDGDRLSRRLQVREAMTAALADGAVGVAAEPCAGGFLIRFAP
ncbi:MAG TPA: GNAT family N-acetyltransferase [Solirubrobacteraceae bacterium]|nr:GNAT family N-acetyltransferase [Solirubrobacteraceae bacterium]